MNTLDEMVGSVLLYRDRNTQLAQYKEVLAVMPEPDGLSLLDVGCGWGDFSSLLPETTRYLGIDVRPECIEVARGVYRDRNFRCTSRITKADIIVAIATIANSENDGFTPAKILIERMWRQAGRAVVLTVHAAWIHGHYNEDVFRSWFPKEPDVFDRRDDFFRVAMYK